MKRSRFLLGLLAVLGMVFFLSACDCRDDDGDGDDGSGSALNNSELATLDQSTAESALGILFMKGVEDIPVDDIIDDVVDQFSGMNAKPAIFLTDWALKRVKKTLLSGAAVNSPSGLLEGTVEADGTCSSGSYQVSGSWTGPDVPATMTELCEISDATITTAMDNCQEYGVTANGQAKISIVGSVCSPESLSVELTDFNISVGMSDTQIAFDALNMVADVDLPTGLTAIAHVSSVMNGDMTIDDVRTEYQDYKEDATFSLSGVTLTTSGSIKGSCIDGWISIDTVSPVTAKYGDCPSSGGIKFSGNGDVTATFNSDGSITIGETSFASCDDLPEVCQ